MTTVIDLPPPPPPSNDDSSEVVEVCERLLKAAREGKVTSLAIAFECGPSVATAFVLEEDNNIFALLGALCRLRSELEKEIESAATPITLF